jgi:hypothetical protein
MPLSMPTSRTVLHYSIAYLLTTLTLVYVFKLPHWVVGDKNSPLVREYYYDMPLQALLLDYAFIAIYLFVAHQIFTRAFGLKWDDYATNTEKMLVVGLTAVAITSFFWVLFAYLLPKGPSFFSRWFRSAGYRAVVYDYVFVCLTYFMMRKVGEKDFVIWRLLGK